MKETNPLLRTLASLRQAFDESENVVVASVRNATEAVGSWFDENETAQVMRLMKALDPDFSREAFDRELREYIVPEVVDAFLSADQPALKAWCGEAVSETLHDIRLRLFESFTDLQPTLGDHGTLSSSGLNKR
jgi:import inner membrane translocase subunit TIM44